jgi:hypothetical protein
MFTFCKALAAFAAIPLTATPLPYTSETSCYGVFADGSTSSECNMFTTGTSGWATLTGWDGGNEVYGHAETYAFAGEVDIYKPIVLFSKATSILSFTGITPGQIRVGMADILIESGTPIGPVEWQPFVSFVGFPEFVCKPIYPGICQAADVPFTLGVPFGFKITAETEATFARPDCCNQARVLGVIVDITIQDAAGNPVPIHAASAVPEPSQLAFVGMVLIAGVYAIRRRTKG